MKRSQQFCQDDPQKVSVNQKKHVGGRRGKTQTYGQKSVKPGDDVTNISL